VVGTSGSHKIPLAFVAGAHRAKRRSYLFLAMLYPYSCKRKKLNLRRGGEERKKHPEGGNTIFTYWTKKGISMKEGGGN